MKFKILLFLLLIQLPFHFLLGQGTKAKSTTAATGSKDVKKKVATKDDDYWTNKYDEIKRILEGLPADEPKKNAARPKVSSTTVKKTEVTKNTTVKEVGKMDRYDSIIVIADSLLLVKDYNQSLKFYNEANALKPEKFYAPRMIDYIKGRIGGNNALKEQSEDLQRKAQIVEALRKANDAVVNKEWETAKKFYSEVLTLNPIPSQKDFAEKKIEVIDLELKRIAVPVSEAPEPVKVKKPKNRREARALQKKEAERITSTSNEKLIVKESKEESKDKISYKVRNLFKAQFGNATDVTWNVKPDFIQVKFMQEGKRVESSYDFDGALLGVSKYLSKDELPATAKNAFSNKYGKYAIGEVIYFVGPQEVAYYVSGEDDKEKVIFRVTGKDDISVFRSGISKTEAGQLLATNKTVSSSPASEKKSHTSEAGKSKDNRKITSTPSSASVATTTVKPIEEDVNSTFAFQQQAIDYTQAELLKRYPSINFNNSPVEQLFEAVDDEVKKESKLISTKVLTEKQQINISDNNNDVKVVCQGITVNGSTAYLKLLIQNNSSTDFLTGAIHLTYLKENGALKKLNPRYITSFPVVKPQKQYLVVYVSSMPPGVSSGDVFVLDLADRMKETKLTLHIPAATYIEQRNINASNSNF